MSTPKDIKNESEIGKYSVVELSDDDDSFDYEDTAEELSDLETLGSVEGPVTSDGKSQLEQDAYTSADEAKAEVKKIAGVKRSAASESTQVYQYKHAQWTKKEREVYRFMKQLEARDLTHHLLSIHGFRAREQARKRSNRASAPTDVDDVRQQIPQGVDAWRPQSIWTRWPLPASEVPRPQPRVWDSSLSNGERSTSRRELEDTLSAFLLETAHSQWKARTPQSTQTISNATRSTSEDHTMNSNSDEDESQEVVFSADDERSNRILRPVISHTISSLDRLLIAVRKSQSNTTRKRFRDNSAPHYRAVVLVDWSQVLGLASIVGIPPTAIARATTRCSAAFGEHMSFNRLQEEAVPQPIPAPQVFSPKDIHSSSDPSARLEEPAPEPWTPQDGCPYANCKWHGRRFPKEPGIQMFRLRQHLREAHLWENLEQPPPRLEIEEEGSGMSGCVHLDGYMVPLTRELQKTQFEKHVKKRRVGDAGGSSSRHDN